MISLTHLTRDNSSVFFPATGFELEYPVTRRLNIETKVRWVWGDEANEAAEKKSGVLLSATWRAAPHWLFSLNSRWDSDTRRIGDERDLLNNFLITLAYQPQAGG